MGGGNLLPTKVLCARFCLLLFLSAGLFSACSSDAARIEAVLAEYCRSKAEGQYAAYCRTVGGNLLLTALRDPHFERNLAISGSNLAAQGTVFLEIYVTSIEVDPLKRQAQAIYLEKFGQGLRTWAVHHESQLEYIDQAWRIISDRILVKK
jgi:hypothetical protein